MRRQVSNRTVERDRVVVMDILCYCLTSIINAGNYSRPSRFFGAAGFPNRAKKGHPPWPSRTPIPEGSKPLASSKSSATTEEVRGPAGQNVGINFVGLIALLLLAAWP